MTFIKLVQQISLTHVAYLQQAAFCISLETSLDSKTNQQ